MKCVKCGRLILRKIIEIVATRGQIFKLNAPNPISAGASPRRRWGSLQRSPRPLAGFKGPTSQEREGKGKKGRNGEGREGRGGRRGGAYF